MKKVIKFHLSAPDFDKYFILKEVLVADFDYVEEVYMVGENKNNGIKRKRDK